MMRTTMTSFFDKNIKGMFVFSQYYKFISPTNKINKASSFVCLLCILLINNVQAELMVPNAPSSKFHYILFDIYPDLISAKDACYKRLEGLGYYSLPCTYSFGSISSIADREFVGTTYIFNAGWLVNQWPFYYIRYIFSQYYVSTGNNDITECEGNPCDLATGKKTQTEIDYSSANSRFTFKRYYQSQSNSDQFDSLGYFWRHNFSSRIEKVEYPHRNIEKIGQKSAYYASERAACNSGWQQIKGQAYRGLLNVATAKYQKGVCQLNINDKPIAYLTIEQTLAVPIANRKNTRLMTVTRSKGHIFRFQLQDDLWVNLEKQDVKLKKIAAGWQFTDLNNTVDIYNIKGEIISSTTLQGRITIYSYNHQGSLDTVIDPNGRTLEFAYDLLNRITHVTSPQGVVNYRYDEHQNLEYVDYPDGTTRQYHYEKLNFLHHLTGITDEKGNRFATWDYDEEGRAILSEHAENSEKVIFAYNDDGTTTVTDALGAQRTYHFDWVNNKLKVRNITGDRCNICGKGDMKERSYDVNGYLSRSIDWQGNQTSYHYDARGRQLSRIEAVGTPEARTINTEWHSEFRLPIKITEPGRETEYHYDDKGQLLSQTTKIAH